jgi:hypothetical protein
VIYSTPGSHYATIRYLWPFHRTSYAWGNPEKNRGFLVNGKSLDITANLSSALLGLHDEERSLLYGLTESASIKQLMWRRQRRSTLWEELMLGHYIPSFTLACCQHGSRTYLLGCSTRLNVRILLPKYRPYPDRKMVHTRMGVSGTSILVVPNDPVREGKDKRGHT